jgi:hypothetical protein
MLHESTDISVGQDTDGHLYEAPRLIEHGSVEELTGMSVMP